MIKYAEKLARAVEAGTGGRLGQGYQNGSQYNGIFAG
jgi:hypothetical protein